MADTEVKVLAERIDALRELLETRLDALRVAVEQLAVKMVTASEFDIVCHQVRDNDSRLDDHEKRIGGLEHAVGTIHNIIRYVILPLALLPASWMILRFLGVLE